MQVQGMMELVHYITLQCIAMQLLQWWLSRYIATHYMTNIAMYLIEYDGTAITWHNKTLQLQCSEEYDGGTLH